MKRVAAIGFISALSLFPQTAGKEAILGQQLLKNLGPRVVQTPDGVLALAQSLSAQPSIDLRTVESDQPLANSFPGGIVYVSTALLQSSTRQELAAIVAHQLAHHTTQQGQRSTGSVYLIGTPAGMCLRTAASGAPIPKSLEARFTAAEAEADILAAHYLERAGYQSRAVKPIFDRFSWASSPTAAPRNAPTLLR